MERQESQNLALADITRICSLTLNVPWTGLMKRNFLKTNIVHCIVGTVPCSMVGAFTLVKKSKQIQIIAVFVSTLFNTIGKLNRFSLINTFCGQLRHSTYI